MTHVTEAELQAWLDRELDPDDRSRVAGHLEACVPCRRVAAELRAAAATFADVMRQHDADLAPVASEAAPDETTVPIPVRRASRLPARAGRAAAVVLLLGAAAAAAMVPGSPLRDLLFPADDAASPPVADVTTEPETVVPASPGASITVDPYQGALTVRVTGFAHGTRVTVGLRDGETAVASLPDGAENARFIVASGLLDVVGSDASADPGEDGVRVQLPRSLRSGVVEIDGHAVVRVSDGRLIALRHVVREGDDEAVFEAGG